MVYRLFDHLVQEQRAGHLLRPDDAYSLAGEYAGVGRTTVVKIVTAVRHTGTVPPLRVPGNRQQSPVIPELVEGRIRGYIFDRHEQGAVCTATHITTLLQDEFQLKIHPRTVQRHLQRMGFQWGRAPGRKASFRERAAIRQQRHDYLHALRLNRQAPASDHAQEVYLDESFLHQHHAAQWSWWQAGDALNRGSGKGRRWCFIHAIRQTGLLPGALSLFEAKHGTGDYHQQFDAPRFQRWWSEQLLPALPVRSLIILDRCSFHRVPRDPVVPTQMRKGELQQWLSDHDITWEAHWLCGRLREEVSQWRDTTPVITAMAAAQGHHVLFLPVHHPELNPIELVWGTVKNHCAHECVNTTNFLEQRQCLEQAFADLITPAYCAKAFAHVQAIEAAYWDTDILLDGELEEVVLDVEEC